MKPSRHLNSPPAIALLAAIASAASLVCGFAQGSLTPPGAPAASMKTLQQIEPRIPISSLPVTLFNSGSFYITTNLFHGGGGAGIQVAASDVTLDLGGWTLTGSAGSGDGILLLNCSNVVVMNGSIRNFGGNGINGFSAHSGRIENVTVNSNKLGGVVGGAGFAVENCTALANNGIGIQAGPRSQMRGCRSFGNADTGLLAGIGSSLTDCVATENDWGFSLNQSRATGCTAYNNRWSGFSLGGASVVIDCLSMTNGADGFEFGGSGGYARSCMARGNMDTGFHSDLEAAFDNCTAEANALGGFVVLSRGRFDECSSIGNGGYGYYCGGEGEVQRVRAIGNTSSGIYVFGSNQVVRASTVVSNSGYGIFARSSTLIADNFVANNAINGGSTSGILIGGTRCRVDHNTVIANGPYGIFYGFLSGVTNNVITRNHVSGHTAANILLPANNHSVVVTAGNLATNLNPYVNFSLP